MVALVESSRLEQARGDLDTDTAHSHVYSVQPAQPKARALPGHRTRAQAPAAVSCCDSAMSERCRGWCEVVSRLSCGCKKPTRIRSPNVLSAAAAGLRAQHATRLARKRMPCPVPKRSSLKKHARWVSNTSGAQHGSKRACCRLSLAGWFRLQDTADLWNEDQVQLESLFAGLLKAPGDTSTDPCFGAGGLGAIGCGAATRGNFREARKHQVRPGEDSHCVSGTAVSCIRVQRQPLSARQDTFSCN